MSVFIPTAVIEIVIVGLVTRSVIGIVVVVVVVVIPRGRSDVRRGRRMMLMGLIRLSRRYIRLDGLLVGSWSLVR